MNIQVHEPLDFNIEIRILLCNQSWDPFKLRKEGPIIYRTKAIVR